MTPEELAYYEALIASEETIDCDPSTQDIEGYNPEEEAEILEEMNSIYFSTRI